MDGIERFEKERGFHSVEKQFRHVYGNIMIFYMCYCYFPFLKHLSQNSRKSNIYLNFTELSIMDVCEARKGEDTKNFIPPIYNTWYLI